MLSVNGYKPSHYTLLFIVRDNIVLSLNICPSFLGMRCMLYIFLKRSDIIFIVLCRKQRGIIMYVS